MAQDQIPTRTPTLQDFAYTLPQELIAQKPLAQRDGSRLLVLDRKTGAMQDRHFYDLPDLLGPNDVLVRNNTKVMPARIFGKKTTGGAVELLLHKELEHDAHSSTWECMSKPGLKVGQIIVVTDQDDATLVEGACVEAKSESYVRMLRFNQPRHEFLVTLEKIGQAPLPPYIDSSELNQKSAHTLLSRYQTYYAKEFGSAAAPTAGLHFTQQIDDKLHKKGVQIEAVTLHVGLGTFLPVKTEDITQHQMHSEWFSLSEKTANNLNQAKKNGKRIIAVGTTTNRVLESCATKLESAQHLLQAKSDETNLYIYPPYQFKFVDSMITNFHLPESTLLMLVSSFVTAPNTDEKFTTFANSRIGRAYAHAIKEKYRFYSFGDAMLIL